MTEQPENEISFDYKPPIDQLLKLGDVRHPRPRPDYESLGIGKEHVPDLIRMSLDEQLNWADSDSDEVWAPVHAWRMLGLLQAEEASEPLTRLFHEFEDTDWPSAELPEVYSRIGPSAIPVLKAYLHDETHNLYPRVTAMSCLQKIAEDHPGTRGHCIDIIAESLQNFQENDPVFNAFIISTLTDLRAKQVAPLIQQAFEANRVDDTITGVWEDVAFELRTGKHPPLKPRPDPFEFLDDDELVESEPREREDQDKLRSQQKAKTKARAKRKQAKKSKQKQRKRK